jgi:hypothetical protein
MPNDASLGMFTCRLHDAHGQSGGTGCEDRIRWSRIVHIGERFYLSPSARGRSLESDRHRQAPAFFMSGFNLRLSRDAFGRVPDHGQVFPGGDVFAEV